MSPLFYPVSAGGIPLATVTATTGSPTIDSATRAGKTIYKFTGSGSITIGTAGTCEVLLVGGGGGGSAGPGGGGGAGGYIYSTSILLPLGTLTVTVGAGGTGTTNATAGNNGTTSVLGPYYSPGGGGGSDPPSGW